MELILPKIVIKAVLPIDETVFGWRFASRFKSKVSPGKTSEGWASARLSKQFPADQHAPDLAGASAEFVELVVPEQPSGAVVVEVSVAAEQLNGVERDLRRLFRSDQDRARSVFAGGFATVASFGDGIDVGLAGVHHDINIGELALYKLERADGLAE